MTWEAWWSLVVVGAVFPLMAFTRIGADIILLGGLVVLLTLGVLSPEQALAGFSSSGVFTVAAMYVLVASIRETGGIDFIVRHVLGQPRKERHALLRMMVPVAALSGFINNTPVVATFIPAVMHWSRRLRIPAYRLLMPLSFASILGGTVTLLGTSTNLVIHGLLTTYYPELHLGIFDIAWVGIPVAVVGLVYLWLFAVPLLPYRRSASEVFENPREFTIEMMVAPGGALVNKTVGEAGLRQLNNLFLVEIEREGNIVSVVGPGEQLKSGDRLVFAGTSDGAVDLQQVRGLIPSDQSASNLEKDFKERRLVEVVVSPQCQFVGRRIRDGHFRTVYGAAVLAVCRNGQRLEGSLGQIRLQPADVLLLEARPPFIVRHRQSQDFLLISQVDGAARPVHEKAWLAWFILAAVALLAATGLVSMMKAAILGAALSVLSGCCTLAGARKSLDSQVLLTIAASYGLGNALMASGAAEHMAEVLLTLVGAHPLGLLIGCYILVAMLTELVTNNAAAVISFPVVMSAAASLGVSPMPYVVVMMFAASASFLTPLGYQTNLMVYGPGGYKLSDYLRVGGLLNVLTAAVALLLIPMIWPWS
ncbi:potassium transporter TrkA [Terasakiispira papahanaumokuakeensis]|uniref:Potassium transporter TrkA n=1 Tax=Terasakiispira papahanaumokuakeensis TaxID=197479 RepID=A0A1E2V843_9GAMM|nr:SLC13 family permease [Terasakiispira papahanaumokuakeensis]ODC02825.1 potassium transporter TrkA [Terasakiispira papahanaumokuakeensis]